MRKYIMKTNNPLKEFLLEQNEMLNGIQKKYLFDNGYGASVIRHDGSYGVKEGLWELAVLGLDGELDYSTKITSDVLPRLSWRQVHSTLRQIQTL
tara:strand:+ start:2660 stop:2944 length:285 start_codon:yes stop_codon:yes gene_type:complete